nr:MAG TPA: hypothetical protein [Caudoviricetes sp.]
MRTSFCIRYAPHLAVQCGSCTVQLNIRVRVQASKLPPVTSCILYLLKYFGIESCLFSDGSLCYIEKNKSGGDLE